MYIHVPYVHLVSSTLSGKLRKTMDIQTFWMYADAYGAKNSVYNVVIVIWLEKKQSI